MRMPFILTAVFLAFAPPLSRADDWVLTASNSVPFGSLCYDGKRFIAWGGNDQGDTVFSVSADAHNWAVITSSVPLAAFAAWRGQYAGVRASGQDVLLTLSTNLMDWEDSSTIYTLLDWGTSTEGFAGALIAISESNAVVCLEVQPPVWHTDNFFKLATSPLSSPVWTIAGIVRTRFLLYDGTHFWRCNGGFNDGTVYRSMTGSLWETPPQTAPVDWGFTPNALTVDRGLAFVGTANLFFPESIQVPTCSVLGGTRYFDVPYTGLYDRVYFNSPAFCLMGSDQTSGSPLLLYTCDGNDWRRQLLPVSLSAFAASSNTIVGVGQGLLYAFSKTAALSPSTNTVRLTGIAIDAAASTAGVRGIAPSGTVIEVQGTTALGTDPEWSPLWTPSVATGGCTDLSIPVAVSSQLFMRAVTVGAR